MQYWHWIVWASHGSQPWSARRTVSVAFLEPALGGRAGMARAGLCTDSVWPLPLARYRRATLVPADVVNLRLPAYFPEFDRLLTNCPEKSWNTEELSLHEALRTIPCFGSLRSLQLTMQWVAKVVTKPLTRLPQAGIFAAPTSITTLQFAHPTQIKARVLGMVAQRWACLPWRSQHPAAGGAGWAQPVPPLSLPWPRWALGTGGCSVLQSQWQTVPTTQPWHCSEPQ